MLEQIAMQEQILGPCQTTLIELFCENSWKKKKKDIKMLIIFAKKLHHRQNQQNGIIKKAY